MLATHPPAKLATLDTWHLESGSARGNESGLGADWTEPPFDLDQRNMDRFAENWWSVEYGGSTNL